MKHRRVLQWITTVAFLLTTTLSAHAFNINLTLTGFTEAQETLFTDAKNYWESQLVGYQDGITIDSLDITASLAYIDGSGGTIGTGGGGSYTIQNDYAVPISGAMTFDSADFGDLSLDQRNSLILHEMAHVIGFGTLWTQNGVYADGTGQYTGAAALAAYKAEFDPSATFVPVELGGTSGTANGHWDEVDGGSGLTGNTDGFGNDMRNELMTGWLNTPTFISQTTLASFVDIGYVLAPVPVPASAMLLFAGLLGIALQRRRS